MALLKGGMFDNSTSALASNTISLTNVFELMEDQNYTVNVSFSVFDVQNVIHNFTSFGEFNSLKLLFINAFNCIHL